MGKISLTNVTVKCVDDVIINRISFDVTNGVDLSIIGPSGSGKSTLAKLLNGSIKWEGTLKINGVEIVKSNFYLLKRYISVIDNLKYSSNNLVIDELFSSLDGLNLTAEEEKNRVNKVVDYFNLKNDLEKKVTSFTVQYKNYLKIIKSLIKNTEFIVFDNVLVNMHNEQKKLVLDYCKQENITFINITSDIEEVLYSSYMICLYNGCIAMEGNTMSCLKEEKIIRRLGYNLPFMVDLSIQLGYYGLVDKIILGQDEMVGELWK